MSWQNSFGMSEFSYLANDLSTLPKLANKSSERSNLPINKGVNLADWQYVLKLCFLPKQYCICLVCEKKFLVCVNQDHLSDQIRKRPKFFKTICNLPVDTRQKFPQIRNRNLFLKADKLEKILATKVFF